MESALSRKIITKEGYDELIKVILENRISIKHGIVKIGNEPFEPKPFKKKFMILIIQNKVNFL